MQGQRFEVVDYYHSCSEKRVFFHDKGGDLQSIPVAWTDLTPPDPFVFFSKGKSLVRVEELLALCVLLEELESRVRETMP
jgi:phytoene dehydrogenase-like protein